MEIEKEFGTWILSVDWDHSRNTYVQFYADAPEWTYERAISLFGSETVLLRSDRSRSQAA